MMWFRKNKIKETKRKPGLYGNRYNNQNYSIWDNMSIIEKIIIVGCPIGFTYIDYMILSLMFELPMSILIIISVCSTILLMALVWLLANWASGE